jgi:hypothetical protein
MPLHMAWYTRESWRRLGEVADGPLAESYDAYVALTEEMIRGFEERGILAVKTLVDVDDMAAWCRQNGYRVDARGRAAYGATMAAWRGQDIAGEAGQA